MEDDGGGSLFEGMVLFTDLDIHHNEVESQQQQQQQTTSSSSPLSEDLFSDLTTITAVTAEDDHHHPPPSTSIDKSDTASSSSSQVRKKKRAVRIGYARQDSIHQQNHHTIANSHNNNNNIHQMQQQDDGDEEDLVDDKGNEHNQEDHTESTDSMPLEKEQKEEQVTEEATTADDLDKAESIDDKEQKEKEGAEEATTAEDLDGLELIRLRISDKRSSLLKTAAALSAERKELERKRRSTLQSYNAVLTLFKDLENELEQACESEDFDKAETVSQRLADAEKDRDSLLVALRDVESHCQSAESKMQDLLHLQIAAEEEFAELLQQFSQESADQADSVLKSAETKSAKELVNWQSSLESLESKKLEMDIELQIVSEARAGMENAIGDLVENDRKEKEMLTTKGEILVKELNELLELVRLKEKEITENKSQLQDVERRIASVISEFHGTQSSVDLKYKNLQEGFSWIESENLALLNKKKEIDEFILSAEQKKMKLMETSSISSDQAKQCRNLVALKKSLASTIEESRNNRISFARTEEKIMEDIQSLKQQILDRRTTLQELSSARASVQQEIASYKQRTVFVEKRGPELEAEKKIAAAARNFKEAARIAAEAKALNVENEDIQQKMGKAALELERLEKEINCHVDSIHESEELVSLKEKEAALAGYKRLLLEAKAARAESSASLQMGDLEEGDILMQEAEIAESKARELQEIYGIELEIDGMNYVSLTSIINNSG